MSSGTDFKGLLESYWVGILTFDTIFEYALSALLESTAVVA